MRKTGFEGRFQFWTCWFCHAVGQPSKSVRPSLDIYICGSETSGLESKFW